MRRQPSGRVVAVRSPLKKSSKRELGTFFVEKEILDRMVKIGTGADTFCIVSTACVLAVAAAATSR